MNPTVETLRERLRSLDLPDLFSRYLTPISVGVLGIGVLLVILGPVRSVAGPKSAGTSGSARPGQPSALVGGGSDETTIDQLDRGLIPFTIIPDRPRKDVVSYTIKPGDTLFGIAGEFGLKPATIFWSNKGTLSDDIHLILPGVTIAIMPVDGAYFISDGTRTFQKIADDYSHDSKVDPNTIINSQYNNFAGQTPNDTPPWGTPVVVPGGTSDFSVPPVITATVSTSGASAGQVVYGFMQGMAGSCAAGIHGGGGTGGWIPPVSSYTVTQPFAPWHSGMDLANVIGTPVHAADTGVVIYSGWVPQNWGYGQLVVLDHGNNWTTYYAHLNSINVGCGQTVPRGGLIGAIGTTGNSNGPHLHFEMRWNHVPDNPANNMGF
jgi:murein DD-endopeptidase MepM/ murein hydrolase activator NlpD